MKPTLVCLQRSLQDLAHDISWAEHKRKGYIIRDPANSDELLYLTESEYNKLIRVMLSNETTLDVIATPRDTPISITKKFFPPKAGESPLRGGISFDRDFIINILPGWVLKESMIEFKRNFKSFLPTYYSSILSWLGIKSSKTNSRLVRRIGLDYDRILRTRGINQVILRLKVSSIAVMQYLSGRPMRSTQDLGLRVKLIHGLPAYLPCNLRNLIRERNINYIRVITSLLHSYKALKGKYGAPDLSSITAKRYSPLEMEGIPKQHVIPGIRNMISNPNFKPKSLPFTLDFLETYEEVNEVARKFWRDFNPLNMKCKLNIDMEKLPLTLTAGVNHKIAFMSASIDALAHLTLGRSKLLLSFIQMVLIEADNPNAKVRADKQSFKHLVEQMQFLAQDLLKYWRENGVDINKQMESLSLGKLSLKYEAAGKIRVFAISDYWTQFVCKPIHNSMFDILRTHPSDATFDQLGAVQSFMKREHYFIASYDLKSATDLIPQQLYVEVLGYWMGRDLAEHWMNLLVNRVYRGPKEAPGDYRYTRGQPMGTLSSWSSLAIIHHYLVYMAATRAGVSKFRDYLVLGDDIVIGDEKVAYAYTEVCKHYGITIGFAKSFTSNNGFFQFASQDILNDVNISPISLKEVLSTALYDRLGSISSGIKSMGAKIEFVNRLIGKGFIDPTNPFNFVRAIMAPQSWKAISKDLSRGIISARLTEFLLMSLSSTFRVNSNDFSVSQLMAVYYGDIGCLTKNKIYAKEEQTAFISELYELLDSTVKRRLNDLMMSISKAQASNLEGWFVNSHFYSTIVNSERAKFIDSLLRIRRDYKEISVRIQADIAHNNILRLITDTKVGSIPIEYLEITKISNLLAEIESLRLEIDVFADAIKVNPDGKLAPRVRAFLSLRSFMERNEKPMSLVAETLLS